jgi:hypothetical protein
MTNKPAKLPPDNPTTSKLQGRQSVYIDTDDDITSIIEKVKNSDSPVVALVPPARVGVLQSVVNLKLLQRAAKAARKKLTLVTNDKVLVNLAAGLKIPVARTVNAQAEVPVSEMIEAADDDIINGDELAIGELAKLGNQSNGSDKSDDRGITAAVVSIEKDDRIKNDADADGVPDDKPTPPTRRNQNKKVPNFNAFRKKLLIFGGLGLLLAAFLVWAIFWAPSGTITVVAQTSAQDVAANLTLSPSANTDINANLISPDIKLKKTNQSLDFEATGSQEIGDKASGSVVIYNTNSITPLTIAAGTEIANGNLRYLLDSAVTVPGVSGTLTEPTFGISQSVSVTAANIGADYNLKANTNFDISGYTTKVYAVAKTDFTGGSKETVKIVQQSDVDLAVEKLKNQVETDKIAEDLAAQLGNNTTAIPDSFSVSFGAPRSDPAVGETPASGKRPSVSIEITYTLMGIKNDDLDGLLNAAIKAATADEPDQKIYDNGRAAVKFRNFQTISDEMSKVSLSTTGRVGPKLDEKQIKDMATGKRSGEIRQALTKIPGINDVQVKFTPFWVSQAPAADKLTVTFAVDGQ